ncbi:MAG TPA: S24/S26 family peptidase [Opitutaceae bacterium]|nr:S24/S26 family peptidase [Opitutaceae bacterium]
MALFRPRRARVGCGAAAFVIAAWCGGCASGPPAPAKPPEPAVSPSTDVTVNDAWRDAKLVAGREPGRTPAAGAGSSMQPVYGDNTMLVISPIDYDQLRPGMTVAYMNHRGVRVVHRLVQKLADGWQVIGLNNDRVDDDVVTRKNLIGVIYASFNTTDEAPEK